MGIMIAKITSARLSYHVARLFSSETQRRLEEIAEGFKELQRQLTQTSKIIGRTFQATPGSSASQDQSSVIRKLYRVIVKFHSRSRGITEYLSYETGHGDFFAIAPTDELKRTAETINRATFLLGQIIIGMTDEAKDLLLDQVNRNLILKSFEEQRQMHNIVNENCKDESVRQKFAQIIETIKRPKSFIAIPVTEPEAEQPDQRLEATDQPLTE
ncbi:hypothetical protein ES703_56627 [subsurface metagenome]